MITQVKVPIALTDPSTVNDTLQELWSSGSVIRHPEVEKLEFKPGEGQYRQYLIIRLKEAVNDFNARMISDEIMCRVVNRTSSAIDVMHYIFQTPEDL